MDGFDYTSSRVEGDPVDEINYNLGYYVGRRIKQYEVLNIIRRDVDNYSYSNSIVVTLADVAAEMGVDIEDYEEVRYSSEVVYRSADEEVEAASKVLVDILDNELMTIRRELRQVGVTYP